jgi:hypothetical protein
LPKDPYHSTALPGASLTPSPSTTTPLGHRLELSRGDWRAVKAGLEKAQLLCDKGGDWERKNKLKVGRWCGWTKVGVGREHAWMKQRCVASGVCVCVCAWLTSCPQSLALHQQSSRRTP